MMHGNSNIKKKR